MIHAELRSFRARFFELPLLIALGPLSGLPLAQTGSTDQRVNDSPDADWTAEGGLNNARFAGSVSSAGDVNGDGFSDVIVGAPGYSNGEIEEGRAYVYLGSAQGLSAGAVWIKESDNITAKFGHSVASAGDVNGDGFSDILVGAWGYNGGAGRAFLYLGSPSGPEASPAWTADAGAAHPTASFGGSVASAGDVNGDGYSDVIVGATSYSNGQLAEGSAFVFHGSPAGLSASPDWTVESNESFSSFASSVSGAGDVNGDGYSDVIVGAPRAGTSRGQVLVYHGSAFGLSAQADWVAEGELGQGGFGSAVSGAGDVDADGFSDVIIGHWAYGNGEALEGRVYVFHGGSGGLASEASWTLEADQERAFLGQSVASARDVNGDGFDDILMGAHWYDSGEADEGRAAVYLGSPTGILSFEVWSAQADQPRAHLGGSVASAGDVNGDGILDVIVGAEQYDNGQIDEGRAFVYMHVIDPLAEGSTFNGSGVNPVCLSSEPARLGRTWNAVLDSSAWPSATAAAVVAFAQPDSGSFIFGGEVLVDLTSEPYFVLLKAIISPSTTLSMPVPFDLSLEGISGASQGIVFASGVNLCNGYTFSIGY